MNSPPKPHAFASLPLQSVLFPRKNKPTDNNIKLYDFFFIFLLIPALIFIFFRFPLSWFCIMLEISYICVIVSSISVVINHIMRKLKIEQGVSFKEVIKVFCFSLCLLTAIFLLFPYFRKYMLIILSIPYFEISMLIINMLFNFETIGDGVVIPNTASEVKGLCCMDDKGKKPYSGDSNPSGSRSRDPIHPGRSGSSTPPDRDAVHYSVSDWWKEDPPASVGYKFYKKQFDSGELTPYEYDERLRSLQEKGRIQVQDFVKERDYLEALFTSYAVDPRSKLESTSFSNKDLPDFGLYLKNRCELYLELNPGKGGVNIAQMKRMIPITLIPRTDAYLDLYVAQENKLKISRIDVINFRVSYPLSTNRQSLRIHTLTGESISSRFVHAWDENKSPNN